LRNTEGLIALLTLWNKDGHTHFWGVLKRTLTAVLNGLRNGDPKLEMPPYPPPPPLRWLSRGTTSHLSSSDSSLLGPTRSKLASSYRVSSYPVPKRVVKEEYKTLAPDANVATTTVA
jgi:hypothetical protein